MSTHSSRLTIDEIKGHLARFLISDMTDKIRFAHWLEMLFSDIYGQVLGVNLYIDLKYNRLNKSIVVKVLNNMVFPSSDARLAFCEYVEKHQDETLFNHLDGPQLLEKDQYVRIMSIIDMIEYYLRQPLKLPSLTYEALNRAV